MTNILRSNSYQILGLNITAPQKEIIKRSKDILNLLAIDEKPEYDLDFGIFNKLRTEAKVKDAVQSLVIPKKRIVEYFFWFTIQDSTDGKAISLIQASDFQEARNVWKNTLENVSSKTFFYKKNLALLDLWILYEKDTQDLIKESVNLWKELVESEEFWVTFSKNYKLNDDLSSDQEIINNFKQEVPSILSDIYTDISKKNGTNIYINEFIKEFGSKGKQFDKTVLTPLYQKINISLDKLNQTAETLDNTKLSLVKEIIEEIQKEFNDVIGIGLFEDSQIKVLRDKAAISIRNIVLKLYNNLRETEKSLGLLNIALKISGTTSLEYKIKEDIKTIEKNKKDDQTIEPILALIKNEEYEEALAQINVDEQKNKNNTELQMFYKNHKKLCITIIAGKKYKEANAYLDKKNFDKSKEKFEEIINYISINLDLFNFNKSAIDKIIENIRLRTSQLNSQNVNQLDAFRNEIVKIAKEKFKDQFESSILIYYFDSYIFSLAADFFKKTRRNNILRNIIIWVVIIIVGGLLNSNSKSNTSNSTLDCSNVSPGQYCCSSANSTQADNLKPDPSIKTDLENLSAKIENERLSLDNTDQSAVDSFNAEVAQYNQNRNDFNTKMAQYNDYLKQNCTLK